MTPDQLSHIATIIYGERWQSALARDLEINIRTVQRWAQGGAPDWVGKKMREFAEITIFKLEKFLKSTD